MDSELNTLYAKLAELEKERNAAVEIAETATMRLQQARTAKEHYHQLWQAEAKARRRLEGQKSSLPDVGYLEGLVIEDIKAQKKRTIHDIIWTVIWVIAAGCVAYLFGWVLV